MSKVTAYAGLGQLKVVGHEKDGSGKRAPVSRSFRDKRVGECLSPICMQFNSDGVLSLRESRVFLQIKP